MGLGSFKSAWQRQTLHFGHERGDTYSVLVLDNRGMGNSDAPLMRYSTSEMARDAVEVLQHVGWLPADALSSSSSSSSSTKKQQAAEAPPPQRTLHVAGISMGGMIAQELACLVPRHLSTLNLLCTAAAIENTTTFWENMVQRAQMLIPKSLEASVRSSAQNTFPLAYLVAPDDVHLPSVDGAAPTPGVRPPRGGGPYRRFATNYERYVAGEMHKRLDSRHFTSRGFVLQLIAAGWHHKSPAQLRAMADAVGRDRILVLHGTADRMISVPHGRKLRDHLSDGGGGDAPGLTAIIEDGMGHVPPLERTEWFHELFEGRIAKGEALDGRKMG